MFMSVRIDQDTQLETLSHSIGRQHHLSLQINDELGEQVGLLDGLDEDLDRTGIRLSRAQRTMDKVSKGAKDNCGFQAFFPMSDSDNFLRLDINDCGGHPGSITSDYHFQDMSKPSLSLISTIWINLF